MSVAFADTQRAAIPADLVRKVREERPLLAQESLNTICRIALNLLASVSATELARIISGKEIDDASV